MIFQENRLPADDSHQIPCLIFLFLEKLQNLKLLSAANYRWRFKIHFSVATLDSIKFHLTVTLVI